MRCEEPGCVLNLEYETIMKDQITKNLMKAGWCLNHVDEYRYMFEKCMCGEIAVQIHDNNPVCEVHWNHAFREIKMENRYPGIENKGEPMTRFSIAVSLPQGKTEPNYGSSIGFFREATKREGGLVKTKTGKSVYRCALDLTKLRTMLEKYPDIKKKDNRSNNDIVWITMFELGDKKAVSAGI